MASAMYRLPFENDGEWQVGRTSWDDPSGDHHPGSQAYAIDFPHPIGGKVRAARGGVVVTTKSTNTINTNDLPDGDPRINDPNFRAGNWVLIRHIDGTVASYDHLNTGDVFVAPGDVVAQGQLIAHSGNTGASSGPHLHFHVRSFWNGDNDNEHGPTIPVFFEDQKHSSFRPMEGAEIASTNAYLRQEDWRRCRKCQVLFLGGRSSRCPKGRAHAAHDGDPLVNHVLLENVGKAYFFKGDRYKRYDVAADGVEPGFPATISAFWPGLWSSDIDAAVVWNNGKAYFFKGDQYIRYDVAADHADPGFPATISQFWPGVWEKDIDAAVLWNNGKAYFFKGDQYIRYDVAADRADPGFPARIKEFWSGLEGNERAAILWPDVGQHEWRLCSKCAGLFSNKLASVCPAGGPHTHAGKTEYSLSTDASGADGEHRWHLCQKCAGLFSGTGADSTCPAGQHHQAHGGGFTLSTSVIEVPQAGWQQCSRCKGLFFAAANAAICPEGGKHAPAGSGRVLMLNSSGAPGQHDWRHCRNCASLFFGASALSACPATGGNAHLAIDNADYSLVGQLPGLPTAPGQHGWRQCTKCAGLFFTLNVVPGKCAAGGTHSLLPTLDYAVM